MKLSQQAKDNIVNREIDLKFSKPISNAEQKLKEVVEQQLKKQISESGVKIPKALIDSGYINVGGEVTYRIEGRRYNVYLSNTYPVKKHSYGHEISVSETIEHAHKDKANLEAERGEFKSKLIKILNSFSTDTQIISAMPELAIYFDEKRSTSTALVPVEQVEAMRKQLAPRDTK